MAMWRCGPATDKDKRFGIIVAFATAYLEHFCPDGSTLKSLSRRLVYAVNVRQTAIATTLNVGRTLLSH